MKPLLLLAFFLLSFPAHGTDISCWAPDPEEDGVEDPYAEYKFADKRYVYVYSKDIRLVFCLPDNNVARHVKPEAARLGQTTIDPKAGLAGISYLGKGKRGARLALYRSNGELVADLKMSELNTTFWLENGKIHAGGAKDGVVVLDFSGKVLERTPPKGDSKGGATAAGRAPP